MKKLELISHYYQFLKDHELTAGDVVVGAGGALCLLGLREETSDIDVDVPASVFQRLLKDGHPTHLFGDVLVIEVTDLIDVHKRHNADIVMTTEGVHHYTPECLLAFKRRLNRPKDQADIAALEKYLECTDLRADSLRVALKD